MNPVITLRFATAIALIIVSLQTGCTKKNQITFESGRNLRTFGPDTGGSAPVLSNVACSFYSVGGINNANSIPLCDGAVQIIAGGLSYNSHTFARANYNYPAPGWLPAFEVFLTVGTNGATRIFNPISGVTDYVTSSGLPVDPIYEGKLVAGEIPGTIKRVYRNGHEEVFSALPSTATTLKKLGTHVVTKVSAPCGELVSFVRNPLSGFLTEINSKGGFKTRLEYLSNGKLSSITSPQGASINYTYDASGNLVTVKSPSGIERKFQYRSGSALITSDFPTAYTYDSSDHIARVENTLRTNQYVNIAHSASSLMLISPTERALITFDTSSRMISLDAALNSTSSLIRVNDIVWTSIGGLSRILEEVTVGSGITKHQYQADGRLISLTQGNGNKGLLTYNSYGDVLTNTTVFRNGVTASTVYEYFLNGDIKSVKSNPSGSFLIFEEDAKGNVTSVNSDGKVSTISYDSQCNPVRVTDSLGRTTTLAYHSNGMPSSASSPDGSNFNFQYNALWQLTGAGKSGGVGRDWSQGYSYDAVSAQLASMTSRLEGTLSGVGAGALVSSSTNGSQEISSTGVSSVINLSVTQGNATLNSTVNWFSPFSGAPGTTTLNGVE